MPTKRNAGFTLIEIILVIAVIAIISIVFLSAFFSHARESARRDSCQSNEKQIALGFKMYIQDYAGKYPPPGPSHTDGILGNKGGWADSLEAYLKSACSFQCPSEPNAYQSAYPEQVDYGYNASLSGVSEASIQHSSDVVLEFEGNQNAGDALTASSSNTSRVYPSRHLGGSNYEFVDGHVKWLESTSAPPGCYPAGSAPGSAFVYCTK